MFKIITLILAVILIVCPSAHASELGNPFLTDQSRNASADAIEGLIDIFSALRDRELKNINGGQAHLAMAADALRCAAMKMERIEIPDSENIILKEVGIGSEQVELFSRPPASDLRQLYKIFIAKTKALGEIADSLAARTDIQLIMPKVAAPLALYVQLGNLVTGVARSASCHGLIDVPLITKILSDTNAESFPAVGPDGTRRAISLTADGSMQVIDTATGRVLWVWREADKARSAVFSPDGAHVVSVLTSGSLQVIDAVYGKVLWRREADNAHSAVFISDGTQVVGVLSDGSLQVIDASNGIVIRHC